MNSTLITAAQLKQAFGESNPPLLLDVRLEDDFHCCHISGAKNNCVYEVVFMERMGKLAPDQSAPICVYGAAGDSLESRIAAEKLTRAGYSHVQEFRDGLRGWKAGGFPLENGTPVGAPLAIADGVHDLDLEESHVEWTGRNLLNRHHGSIKLKDGSLRFEKGILVGGEVIFDMSSITCENLTGTPLHDVLVGHLKSDDFFDVERYPTARFEIISSEVLDDKSGAPNLAVHGRLTLKNVTDSVEFTAAAGVTPEGQPAAQAAFAFDRTKWNVLYGSGRFFHRLAGHLVNDLIEVQVRMVGK
jgi:polyisoprenoid-binding protein YceI